MALIKGGSAYYPMQTRVGVMGGNTYYDRAHREKSWFFLALSLPGGKFIPRGSTSLITADDLTFCTHSRGG